MKTLEQQSRFGDAVMIAFLAAQVLDGVLTYQGIRDFGLGVEIEGNGRSIDFREPHAPASAKVRHSM